MYDVTSLIATAIVLPLLGFIAVTLRFYVRLYLKPTFIGVDDWLALIAIVLVCGQGANQIVGRSLHHRETKKLDGSLSVSCCHRGARA